MGVRSAVSALRGRVHPRIVAGDDALLAFTFAGRVTPPAIHSRARSFMSLDVQKLTAIINRQLAPLAENPVALQIRALLVEPTLALRRWYYGNEGERRPCWTVLRHAASNSGIAYCEHGFDPRSPWGLVFPDDDEELTSVGMDWSWHSTFLHAFFDSRAATHLPIWRVFKTDAMTGERRAISQEGEWDKIWAKVIFLRNSDQNNRYDCWTSINYDP